MCLLDGVKVSEMWFRMVKFLLLLVRSLGFDGDVFRLLVVLFIYFGGCVLWGGFIC